MDTSPHISQHWHAGSIVLSYFISVTGSFCTIQLMEQWRQYETAGIKALLLLLSAVGLGGCGIWCMHFTGMNALQLILDDGTQLEIHFELGITILSFVFPVVGVFIGLKIASGDPFFLEIESTRRKTILVKELKHTAMKDVVNKKTVARNIKITALFGGLWHILGGGLFAALGVLVMHYLGMSAQRTNATMELHVSIVALSCVIAFATATAAFWILFRVLTFWPEFEWLRVSSALIMGIAVCGTHYSGMGAATYTHTVEDFKATSRFTIDGAQTSIIASHAAILLCYWLTSLTVVRSVKLTEAKSRSRMSENGRGSQLAHGTSAKQLTQGTATSARSKVYVKTAHKTSDHNPV